MFYPSHPFAAVAEVATRSTQFAGRKRKNGEIAVNSFIEEISLPNCSEMLRKKDKFAKLQ